MKTDIQYETSRWVMQWNSLRLQDAPGGCKANKRMFYEQAPYFLMMRTGTVRNTSVCL